MTQYKTKDGSDVVLPGIGATVNGVIETDQKIENPLFEEVSQSNVAPVSPTVTPAPVAPTPIPATPTNLETS